MILNTSTPHFLRLSLCLSLRWPLSTHSEANWATEMPSLWSTPGATTMPLQEEIGIPSLWRSSPGPVIGYWLIKKRAQFGAFWAQTNRGSK